MIDVEQITKLQRNTVVRWHAEPIDNPFDGLLATVCKQHSFNFLLWHEEDIARRRDVDDGVIATVKRAIDGYNQQRNDWIEKVDDEITSMVKLADIKLADNATLNTETPGSAIDRLSIMALRVFHLNEHLENCDSDPVHLKSVGSKLAICEYQQADLSQSLQQLLDDIFAGRKRHQTYRQNKMYNDPSLNPYLRANNQSKRAA